MRPERPHRFENVKLRAAMAIAGSLVSALFGCAGEPRPTEQGPQPGTRVDSTHDAPPPAQIAGRRFDVTRIDERALPDARRVLERGTCDVRRIARIELAFTIDREFEMRLRYADDSLGQGSLFRAGYTQRTDGTISLGNAGQGRLQRDTVLLVVSGSLLCDPTTLTAVPVAASSGIAR